MIIGQSSVVSLALEFDAGRNFALTAIIAGAQGRLRVDSIIVPAYRFHQTKHQALRVSERDLSFENMKNVVCYPDESSFLRKGLHGGRISKFRKTVEGRTLVVVAEIKGKECWLLTGFFAG